MDDLHRILNEAGHRMSRERIRTAIKAAGFRWRKAKVVLTSTDPQYRAKLDQVKKILSELKARPVYFVAEHSEKRVAAEANSDERTAAE